MKLFLKDTKTDKNSASLTVLYGTWIVVMIKVLLSGVAIANNSFGVADPMLMIALLAPVFGYRSLNKLIGAKYGSAGLKPTEEEK